MNKRSVVTSSFSDVEVMAKINVIVHKAQKKLDAAVLADSNYYCPQDTETLKKSAIINTVLGSGRIVWTTPYAHSQYYGVYLDHSKSRNPNATAKWFESAKARKLEQWEKLVRDEFKHS